MIRSKLVVHQVHWGFPSAVPSICKKDRKRRRQCTDYYRNTLSLASFFSAPQITVLTGQRPWEDATGQIQGDFQRKPILLALAFWRVYSSWINFKGSQSRLRNVLKV